MTHEQLFALACQAIEDGDARVVLADALELSGWRDDRVAELGGGPAAVAAVLLFAGWPTQRDVPVRFPVLDRAAPQDVYTRLAARIGGIPRPCQDPCYAGLMRQASTFAASVYAIDLDQDDEPLFAQLSAVFEEAARQPGGDIPF